MRRIHILLAILLCLLMLGAPTSQAGVTTTLFSVIDGGPFSGPPYPTDALQVAVFNQIPGNPIVPVQTDTVLLKLLIPPDPIHPSDPYRIEAHTDFDPFHEPPPPGQHAFFDAFYPGDPTFPGGTFSFSLIPGDPTRIISLGSDGTSFDVAFDEQVAAGLQHYFLHGNAEQSLALANFSATAGSVDFQFDLGSSEIDSTLPIVAMTLTGTLEAVPEPGTLVIFIGLGGLGLIASLRRGRRVR